MVIIDDGSAMSSATESDLIERLHQIGDRASVLEELVELEALVREGHDLKFFDRSRVFSSSLDKKHALPRALTFHKLWKCTFTLPHSRLSLYFRCVPNFLWASLVEGRSDTDEAIPFCTRGNI